MSGSGSVLPRNNKAGGDSSSDNNNNNTNDLNEKEEKIRSGQGSTLRRLVLLFMMAILLLVGILVLIEEESTMQQQQQQQTRHRLPQQIHLQQLNSFEEEKSSKIVQPSSSTSTSISTTLSELIQQVNDLDSQVRKRKATTGIIMEIDPQGLFLTNQLQKVTHQLLIQRYGQHTSYRVQVDLIFPESVSSTSSSSSSKGYLILEMAPIALLPVSVYYFLEMARTWKQGVIHRNANHVLQISSLSDAHGQHTSMPFQEYSNQFPHVKGSTGYAGRPSGPEWYINIRDNTKNHGPGSQQKHNPYEADSNFGTVVEGMNTVVPRIHAIPQKEWLDKEYQINIPSMHILIPTSSDATKFVEWKRPT